MNEFKIATWNVNSITVRLPQLLRWLDQEKPDVLAIQETKTPNEKFPQKEIEAANYHVCFSGQRTYNGVAILSRDEPSDVLTDIPDLVDEQRRILIARINNYQIINLYVPNGQAVDSPKYQYKLQWLDTITHYIRTQLTTEPRLIVLGDFNIAPAPEDVHDPTKWNGQVLFSQPERNAFQRLLDLGLVDTFRLFQQPEKSYTWWDYRQLALPFNHGLRIDHILVNKVLAQHCIEARIDKAPRKWQRPSDHAPVVVVFRKNPA